MSVTFSKVAVSFAIYLYVFANAEAICALFNPLISIMINVADKKCVLPECFPAGLLPMTTDG